MSETAQSAVAARAMGLPEKLVVSTIISVELNEPLPSISRPGDRDVLIVAWLCGEPVGMVLLPRSEPASPTDLARVLDRELGQRLRQVAERHGLQIGSALTEDGLPHQQCPVIARQESASLEGEGISVIVCTRDRPDSLWRCLESLLASNYRNFELIIVDNAPKTDSTAQLARAYAEQAGVPVRYLLEPRPGLSRARNTGIAAAAHELIAFVDDDERVDRHWLTAISIEFADDDSVGCVSGIVLPAELETSAQVNFEEFGGHSKGRGFQRVVFDNDYVATTQSAMYPLPPFGVGANMAFRKAALRAIGQFDVALGAGTPTQACEDTYAFSELLLSGWRMVYTPAAVTWHYHRSEDGALMQQLRGYGIGLGAYYAALVTRDPRRVLGLLRLLPHAVGDLRRADSPRNTSIELPDEIARANIRPRLLLTGPLVYWRERWRSRRSTARPKQTHAI